MFDLFFGIVRGRSEELCHVWEKKNSRGSPCQRAVPRRARTCRRVGERHIIGRNSGTFERRTGRREIAWLCLYFAVVFFRSFSNLLGHVDRLLYRSFFRNQGHQVSLYKNVRRNSCDSFCVGDLKVCVHANKPLSVFEDHLPVRSCLLR